jgi:lipid-binding SYLF domain-containing protein
MKNSAMKLGWLALALALLLAGCAAPKGESVQAKRNYVQQMKNETLNKLYKEAPEARQKVANAPGYAVFSSINTNLFVLSSSSGYGVCVDKAGGRNTYMKMMQVGVGPGLGVKDYRAVFIFRNREVLKQFVEKGWEFGGHADAAAKSGEKGGAVGGQASFETDMEIYTLTEAGVALQATLAGTKYWLDKELN